MLAQTLDQAIARKPIMPLEDAIQVRGFYRVQLTEHKGKGKKRHEVVLGDSGYLENAITNEGRRTLARLLGALAGSSQISHAALGTGTQPGAADTTLNGELGENVRATLAAATNGSTSVQFTGTFSSSNNFVTATRNISNIGLFFTSSGGTIFAGNTYTSSACATNQNVNFTYVITV